MFICRNLEGSVGGARLTFVLYNTTERGISGLHYDPLFYNGEHPPEDFVDVSSDEDVDSGMDLVAAGGCGKSSSASSGAVRVSVASSSSGDRIVSTGGEEMDASRASTLSSDEPLASEHETKKGRGRGRGRVRGRGRR